MKPNMPKVISASRRLEMVGFFPQKIVDFLTAECPPDKVHTIVLWSKHPSHILTDSRLHDTLRAYDQLFLHFTISGMGNTFLEPHIPSTNTCLAILPEIVEYLGDPKRIRIRFDPIVHLKFPSGRSYTNLPQFPYIIRKAFDTGIEDVFISWMEAYPKVIRRLEKYGIEYVPLTAALWNEEKDMIFEEAEKIGVRVSGCCVPRLPTSKCIDGALLSGLHPKHQMTSFVKAKGQRPLCGCTESWDIGWYTPCPGGCLYCYAMPVEYPRLTGAEPGEEVD